MKTILAFWVLLVASWTNASGPCDTYLQKMISEQSVWTVNTIQGSTRLVASCMSGHLIACVAMAEPRYPEYSSGGPYLDFQILNAPEGTWSYGHTFFTDTSKVKINSRKIYAETIRSKGFFGLPGRFGGTDGFKDFFDLDKTSGVARYRSYHAEDSTELFPDWELKQDQTFTCTVY